MFIKLIIITYVKYRYYFKIINQLLKLIVNNTHYLFHFKNKENIILSNVYTNSNHL